MDSEFINEIHIANPIVDVASEYLSLKRAGKNYVCCCPFHSEKSPSCTFFPDTQSFYCFGCGTGGDVITFIKKMENMEFMEAVEKLAARAGMTIPADEKSAQKAALKERIYEINREAANFYYRNLLQGEDKAGLLYFSRRALKPATIKKYGLGYAPDSWDALYTYLHHKGFTDNELIRADVCRQRRGGGCYDMFRNRVMFPIVDLKGRIIGFGGRVLDDSKPKYLNTSDTPVFDKGSYCFSMNYARNSPSKTLILCEGYMDVIAMNQAGFENAIATLGTAITPAQARLISSYADNVVISYDSDEAGQRATRKAINYLSEVGVRTSILRMEGAKDPDEYIKTYGAERFRQLLNNSGDAVTFELERCARGLDYKNNDMDKAELIKRAAAVLAGITSDLMREIYLSKTSRMYDFNGDTLKNYVDQLRNKNRRSVRRQNWRAIEAKTAGVYRSGTARGSSGRRYRSEKKMIGALLNKNNFGERILSSLKKEDFKDELCAKVFDILSDKNRSDEGFYQLSGLLEDEEMARISEMMRDGISVSEEDVSVCIDIIKNDKGRLSEKDTISDEDLLAITAKKQQT